MSLEQPGESQPELPPAPLLLKTWGVEPTPDNIKGLEAALEFKRAEGHLEGLSDAVACSDPAAANPAVQYEVGFYQTAKNIYDQLVPLTREAGIFVLGGYLKEASRMVGAASERGAARRTLDGLISSDDERSAIHLLAVETFAALTVRPGPDAKAGLEIIKAALIKSRRMEKGGKDPGQYL